MENSVPCCVCCQGNGATLNGRPIRASAAQDLPRALLATEIGVTRDAATFQVGGGGGGCGCGCGCGCVGVRVGVGECLCVCVCVRACRSALK